MSKRTPYFSRWEWSAFWITFAVSMGVYLYTLAPNVGLEDSGELLTATYHFGVPHAPGYPSWTILGYLFEKLIPYGNAAWRVNFMSAFFGGLTASILTLISVRLSHRLLKSESFKNGGLPGVSQERLSQVIGMVAGLIFAFIDTMWSQAVISEVYTLNGFFFTVLCLMVMRWFDAPTERRWPCLISLVFGIGITNHQTLLVSGPAFLFVMRTADRELYRRLVLVPAIACAILAWQTRMIYFLNIFTLLLLADFIYLTATTKKPWSMGSLVSLVFALLLGGVAMSIFSDGLDFAQWQKSAFWLESRGFWMFISLFLVVLWGILIAIDATANKKLDRPTVIFGLSLLMFLLGASIYFYMPLSSFTNPPMNWGHVQSVQEFRHQILRGQYEPINVKRDLSVLVEQFGSFFTDLTENFGLPLVLLGIIVFFNIRKFQFREKNYFAFTILCFIHLGLLLVILLNPKLDEQSIFINRVFYSLAHGVYSIWIGFGIILLIYHLRRCNSCLPILIGALITAILGWILYQVQIPQMDLFVWLTLGGLWMSALYLSLKSESRKMWSLGLVAILPVIPFSMNWEDCEMHGHDYGWRYGRNMLKDLDRDAVVYGGTDPGRFVPTYMIFVESFQPKRWREDPEFDRRDLYIITQNALADETYMNYVRDHYSTHRPAMDKWYYRLFSRKELYPVKPLIIPDGYEFEQIFNSVVDAYKDIPNGFVVTKKNEQGQVVAASISGVEGVFKVNGALAQWIFEKNKKEHSFYLEESYPLDWMYPYLEPVGLIMKINKEPIPELTHEMVAKDMAYWSKLIAQLMSEPEFIRDVVARKSYSKLRSSLGGLYNYRKMWREAERALVQSLDLYPASSEGRTRLIECYIAQDRYADAVQVALEWDRYDHENPAVNETLERVKKYQNRANREADMRAAYPGLKHDPSFVLEFANLLKDRGNHQELDAIMNELMDHGEFGMQWWQSMLQFYADANRPEQMERILKILIKKDPKNSQIWYNLAIVYVALDQPDTACQTLKEAIKLEPGLKAGARQDKRFQGLQNFENFRKITGQQ